MSEWSEQLTDFQRNRVEQQQPLLSVWVDSMKSAGGDSTRAGWLKDADIMEQQVDSALNVQKRSLLSFAQSWEDVVKQTMAVQEEWLDKWTDAQATSGEAAGVRATHTCLLRGAPPGRCRSCT